MLTAVPAEYNCLCGALAQLSQGTNALVLLETSRPAAPSDQPLIWRRRRFWAAPAAHATIRRVADAGRCSVELEAHLHGATLAYLRDHRCHFLRCMWTCVWLCGNHLQHLLQSSQHLGRGHLLSLAELVEHGARDWSCECAHS